MVGSLGDMNQQTAPTTRTYPHGVPCWIDTEQPDVDAATRFYGALFGWTFEERPAPNGERYVIANLDGLPAAAIASARGGTDWNTYIRVDELDTTLARALAAGATEQYPACDTPAGRWAAFQDPHGASLRLWQPGHRQGAQIANVPGAWNFTDLATPEPGDAAAWYQKVLGWESSDAGFATMLRVPGYGRHLADTVDPDIFERQQAAPEGFSDAIGWIFPGTGPARWATTFTVADRDEAAATAERAGATVLATAENEWTRTATIRDPQGAELTLSQLAPTGL